MHSPSQWKVSRSDVSLPDRAVKEWVNLLFGWRRVFSTPSSDFQSRCSEADVLKMESENRPLDV